MSVSVTGSTLTLDDVLSVARDRERVDLDPVSLSRMQDARRVVERALDDGREVYGLTTGVNAKKDVAVPVPRQAELNRLLLLSHQVGQGSMASAELAWATLLVLVNGLVSGVPGVRPELARVLADRLNEGVAPTMRMLGSLGQADLAPLADLAVDVLGDFPLEANEALALIDNNAFSTAGAALALAGAGHLMDVFDVAAALDMEAFGANVDALHPAVGAYRPYPGLKSTITRLRTILEGSCLWADGAARNLQDPLSFRCVPQVHGCARDGLDHSLDRLALELNSSQGNPMVLLEEERIISAGNFDIAPLAAAIDYARICLAPALTSACERTVKLLQAPSSGLPQGLSASHPSPEDALSEFGVAIVALTSEARLLAQPVSFELASTSIATGIEDRMTMAPLAARRLSEMVELGLGIASIELTVAAQALDLRGQAKLGEGTSRAYRLVRQSVPFAGAAQPPPVDLESVRELARSNALTPPL